MRSVAVALSLALAALGCDSRERPPTHGGGGGGGGQGGQGGADGAPGDAEPGALSGSLCRLADLRRPPACGASVSGVVVADAIGGASATSAGDGRFALAADPQAAILEVGFAEATFRPTVTPAARAPTDDGLLLAPAVLQGVWDQLLLSIGVAEPDDRGSLIVYVQRDDQPLAGAQLIPPDGSSAPPLYDSGPAAEDWDFGGTTGPEGAILVVGVPADVGAVTFQVAPAGGGLTQASVPIAPAATTFVVVSVP